MIKTIDHKCLTRAIRCQYYDNVNNRLQLTNSPAYKLIKPDIQKFTNQCIKCPSNYHLIYEDDYNNLVKTKQTPTEKLKAIENISKSGKSLLKKIVFQKYVYVFQIQKH